MQSLRSRGIRPATFVVLVSALLLYVLYLTYTSPLERNPDASSHLAYVHFLVTKHKLPSNQDCSVCHHPPLYYLLSVGVLAAVEPLHLGAPDKALQVLSLALFLLFIGFAALSAARSIRHPYLQPLAVALIAFWPYSVINSIRVNNDTLLYAISGMALYSLFRWWERASTPWLWGAALAAALGLFAKANAIALIFVIFAVVGFRIMTARDRRLFRSTMPVVAALLAALALSVSVRGEGGGGVAKNVLGSAYKTAGSELSPRSAKLYLTFDPGAFVKRPYAVTFNYRSTEPTFWNHLVKSSLFGTQNAPFMYLQKSRHPNPTMPGVLNYVLLGMLSFLAIGAVITRRELTRGSVACGVAALAYVASALAFHLLVPAGHHADFRFIFPTILPLSVLFCQTIEALHARKNPLFHLGLALGHVFLGFSIAYFVPLTFVK